MLERQLNCMSKNHYHSLLFSKLNMSCFLQYEAQYSKSESSVIQTSQTKTMTFIDILMCIKQKLSALIVSQFYKHPLVSTSTVLHQTHTSPWRADLQSSSFLHDNCYKYSLALSRCYHTFIAQSVRGKTRCRLRG